MSTDSGPGERLPRAGTAVLEQAFDGDSLYALRAAVAAHASEAGLPRQRVYDVVAAVHELAANAVRHGAGHGRLRLWADGQALHCQVSDDGLPARTPPALRRPGKPCTPTGCGSSTRSPTRLAWTATISGTTVTAIFLISSPS